jgi:hypothetical protein
MNTSKFSQDYVTTELKQACLTYFQYDYFNILEYFEMVKSVFSAILSLSLKGFHKTFTEIVKIYIRKFFLVFEKDKDYSFISTNIPFDYIIDQCDAIIQVLQLSNDNNFIVDFVVYIIKNVVERADGVEIATYEKFDDVDYREIYFQNIHKFYTSLLSKQIVNKYINPTFFKLFDTEEADSDGCLATKKLVKIVFQNLHQIIVSQIKLDNEDFFSQFILNFEKIEKFFDEFPKYENWREIKIVLDSLQRYLLYDI